MTYTIAKNRNEIIFAVNSEKNDVSIKVICSVHYRIIVDVYDITMTDKTFDKSIVGFARFYECFLKEVDRFYRSENDKTDLDIISNILTSTISC